MSYLPYRQFRKFGKQIDFDIIRYLPYRQFRNARHRADRF